MSRTALPARWVMGVAIAAGLGAGTTETTTADVTPDGGTSASSSIANSRVEALFQCDPELITPADAAIALAQFTLASSTAIEAAPLATAAASPSCVRCRFASR